MIRDFFLGLARCWRIISQYYLFATTRYTFKVADKEGISASG